MNDKHLIVISADAFVYEDLEYASTLPNLGRFIKEGAVIERVKTIYPSLTHPVHATMITGVPAGVSGVTSNVRYNPNGKSDRWYNFLSELGCESIFHEAKRRGLTTAASRWPLTAGDSGVIDYLVPEFMHSYEEEYGSDTLQTYRALGASEDVIGIIEEAISRYGHPLEHPYYDDFQIFCASQIIRKYKPNIMFTHPAYIDNARHRTGLFTADVKTAIKRTDEWIGELVEAVRDAGIEDKTDFIVLGDHGHLNICRRICPNVYFADAGYIKLDSQGNIVSRDAYALTCGLSAHIYLSRPDDGQLYSDVYELLCAMAEEKIYGFERVFTTEEVKEKYGLFGDFSFVIETDGFTSFDESCQRPLVRGFDITDYRFGRSTHGHLPERGPQPTFVAYGPSVNGGTVVPSGSIINHAATFARFFDMTLPCSQGTAEEKIFK